MPGTDTISNSKAAPKLELVEHYSVPFENGMQVRSATQSAVLSGRIVKDIFPKLLPLLDGTRTKEQLFTELSDVMPAAHVTQVLEFLKQKSLIREVEEVPQELADEDLANYESLARFFGRRGSRYATLAALKSANIGIVNAGPVLPVLVSSLAQFGVKKMHLIGPDALEIVETQQSRFYQGADKKDSRSSVLRNSALAGTKDLQLNIHAVNPVEITDWAEVVRDLSMVVVLLQGPIVFHPWLEKLNAAALAAGMPWTSVALLDGDSIHVGPTIRPGVTACYKCFELRLKSNLARLDSNEAFEAYLHQNQERIDFGFLPPVAEIVAGLAAIETVRTLSPDTVARTSGKLMMFNISDLTTTFHPILKLPRCPACSPARNQPSQRVWS